MNVEANDLAQEALGFNKSELALDYDIPSDELAIDQIDPSRQELVKYLWDPFGCRDLKLRRRALKYVLIGENRYKRSMNGVLLK